MLAKLHGRTVFAESEFDTVFGVLGLAAGGDRIDVTHVANGATTNSGLDLGYLKSVSLARFREPVGDELTHEVLVDGEAFVARMNGTPYDAADVMRQVRELDGLVTSS